jgi:magnesium chelatase family protein
MGQEELINAYRIAASGHHHMILIGPPGSGKTMSASRLPTILPYLNKNEIIEINKIYSIFGINKDNNWITFRPFRSPHNSSSSRAMIGGGPRLMPGEISLAHKGILFLDEFLEFRSDTLQALRTVIEKKEVYISLRNGYAIYPADFLLVAASNPCPCGFYGTKEGYCSCSLAEIKRYNKKLRNPLIDRIDLQVKVDRINYKELIENKKKKSTAKIKKDVITARNIQKKRFKNEDFSLNSEIPAEKISQYCILEKDGYKLLEKYMEDNLLTARSCHKILRIARTIADLKKHEIIKIEDINEAFQYRVLDIENI